MEPLNRPDPIGEYGEPSILIYTAELSPGRGAEGPGEMGCQAMCEPCGWLRPLLNRARSTRISGIRRQSTVGSAHPDNSGERGPGASAGHNAEPRPPALERLLPAVEPYSSNWQSCGALGLPTAARAFSDEATKWSSRCRKAGAVRIDVREQRQAEVQSLAEIPSQNVVMTGCAVSYLAELLELVADPGTRVLGG